MPLVYSLSLAHGMKVCEHLLSIVPDNVDVFIDADTTEFGEGVLRFAKMNVQEQRPVKACWVSVVVGNQLMITKGDLTNFRRFKHDSFTPHIDRNMSDIFLPCAPSHATLVFDYDRAAKVILEWLLS